MVNSSVTQNAFTHTYRASELVVLLQSLIAQHGDLPVVAKDPDTSCRLKIGAVFKPEKPVDGFPPRFEIRTDYHDRPEGAKPAGELEHSAGIYDRYPAHAVLTTDAPAPKQFTYVASRHYARCEWKYDTLKEAIESAVGSLWGDEDYPVEIREGDKALWNQAEEMYSGFPLLRKLAEENGVQWST